MTQVVYRYDAGPSMLKFTDKGPDATQFPQTWEQFGSKTRHTNSEFRPTANC